MASSPPPTLTTYEDILNSLNRDVSRARPDDPLQYCANWFNERLADQRAAARNSANAMMDVTPTPAPAPSSRHASPAPRAFSPPPAKSALKKKTSTPSLVGSGYSFGGHAAHLAHQGDGVPSPYSEVPPSGPFGPSGASPHGMSRASAANAASAAAAHQGPASWSRSFTSQSASTSRSTAASDDEDEGHGHRTPSIPQGPSAGVSPIGIPLAYNLGRRTSVSAESLDPDAMAGPKRVIPKSSGQRKRIEAVMTQNLLFRNLDEAQHHDVINAMEETTVGQGAIVIHQGDVGEIFYIVEHGTFEVYKRPDAPYAYDPADPSRSTSPPPSSAIANAGPVGPYPKYGKLVGKVEAGGHFGELALMYNAPRAATVICTSAVSVLWSVDRVTFRSILMEHTSRKRRMYERFLSEVPILATLEPHERAKVADSLEERVYDEGEAVVVEGEVGKNFYLIESGTAEVTKRRGGNGDEERVSTLTKGDYFGELALINSAPRAATVRALPGQGRLRVATLGEKAFTRLLGPVVEILQRRAATTYGPQHGRSGSAAGLHDLRHQRQWPSSQQQMVAVAE